MTQSSCRLTIYVPFFAVQTRFSGLCSAVPPGCYSVPKNDKELAKSACETYEVICRTHEERLDPRGDLWESRNENLSFLFWNLPQDPQKSWDCDLKTFLFCCWSSPHVPQISLMRFLVIYDCCAFLSKYGWPMQ